jgi:hypothetical protein
MKTFSKYLTKGFLFVSILNYAQNGDPYSSRNANASQDWIASQQKYSQSVIDSYRSTSSGVGISVNGGSAKYSWESKAEDEKARAEARQRYCEKFPDVCEFSRKRDSATAAQNAKIAAYIENQRYTNELKCKQQKKEQQFLEKAGYKSSEITLFIDNNYLADGLTPNMGEYSRAAAAYQYCKNNIKNGTFEAIIYNLYYMVDNGFYHTSYEFLDQLKKRFSEKENELEQFNLYLCQRFLYFPLVIRYDTGLFNMIRSWEIYYRERAIWEFYQYTLKYPDLAYDQYVFYMKNKNDFSIDPLHKLYYSLYHDTGSLRGYKRYVEDMTKRKELSNEVYKLHLALQFRYQEEYLKK